MLGISTSRAKIVEETVSGFSLSEHVRNTQIYSFTCEYTPTSPLSCAYEIVQIMIVCPNFATEYDRVRLLQIDTNEIVSWIWGHNRGHVQGKMGGCCETTKSRGLQRIRVGCYYNCTDRLAVSTTCYLSTTRTRFRAIETVIKAHNSVNQLAMVVIHT